MILDNTIQHAAKWLSSSGQKHDVVISSRVRLARNLLGMPFPNKCNDTQSQEVCDKIFHAIELAKIIKNPTLINLNEHDNLDRDILVERHLISRQHAHGNNIRSAVISEDEQLSLMINEEDHLRIQLLHSGLFLREAFDEINTIDNELAKHLNYAFMAEYGHLTACPTNLGTGLRVSVMLHLPGLKLSGEIDRAMRASKDMDLAIRGIYGEGTEAIGDFYQISNQLTLGISEEQIVDSFTRCFIPAILDYERKAREQLFKKNRLELEDIIFRSLAVMRNSRLIDSEEALEKLSMIRLGINMNCISDINLDTVNELYLLSRPAHLQRLHNAELSPRQRDETRSKMLRERLTKPKSKGKAEA